MGRVLVISTPQSRKFKELRRRVQQTFLHGFGGLGFAKHTQSLHPCRRFEQEKRFVILFFPGGLRVLRGAMNFLRQGHKLFQHHAASWWDRKLQAVIPNLDVGGLTEDSFWSFFVSSLEFDAPRFICRVHGHDEGFFLLMARKSKYFV